MEAVQDINAPVSPNQENMYTYDRDNLLLDLLGQRNDLHEDYEVKL